MAEIEFELFNNQLVQQLVGPQDGNLKIIEKALAYKIVFVGPEIIDRDNILNATMSGSGPTVFGIFREETGSVWIPVCITAVRSRHIMIPCLRS